MYIEGAIAVKSAIHNRKRKVSCVYIDKAKKTKDFNYIRQLCKKLNIKVKECERLIIDEIASGKSHGGIVADVEKRQYQKLEVLLKNDNVFYVDGIEDPFNLGYVFRTLYAFGFSSVILRQYDYEKLEGTLLKSSAGAFDCLDIYLCDDINKMLETTKQKGYQSFALYRNEEAKDLFVTKLPKKAVYLLGGEKRGIAASVLEDVDKLLYIPYGNNFKMALSAASAVDVLATVVFQRRSYR